MSTHEYLLPEGLLAWPMEHDPCCSSHGVKMSCPDYRRTHFVEVGNCCDWWKASMPQYTPKET